MWIIILSLACIITMTTGMLSQSIVHKNENGLKYTVATIALHGNTKTKRSVFFKLDQRPYRIGVNAVHKYKLSMIERHKNIHIDDTYPTPKGELSRHIHGHEEADVIVNHGNVSTRLARRQAAGQTCRRFPLSVNFRSIGWVWIHSPKEFNAFVCQGECGNPIYDASTPLYAQVQARVNTLQPSKNKPLCCVPTKTSSLDVEYYVGKIKHTLNMREIIVEECGCH